jgi:hypothetical protein
MQKLQEIRKKLCLFMDGANASSMRKKGVEYKHNFGVPVIVLRRLADQYTPDAGLAEALWKEDVREFKLLATLIQPAATYAKADVWVESVNNIELAEQFCMNLMPKVHRAGEYAGNWVRSEKLYTQICGFLLYARLFMKNFQLEDNPDKYFHAVFDALAKDSPLLKNAALTSLKRLGRQSVVKARDILAEYEIRYPNVNDEQQAIYDDLKFEFDFYQA